MKYLALCLILLSPLLHAQEAQEWEGLDLEKTQMEEMQKQREEYEDREGDLQIQAEEEEIIPLESEDSRNIMEDNTNSEED